MVHGHAILKGNNDYMGCRPIRRGPFVSAKGPKTISARLRPQWGPSAKAPNKMARELALLKQLSPRSRFGASAPPHPKAGFPQKQETPKTNSNFSGFSDRTKRISPVISSLTRNLECGRTTDFS